MKNASLLFVVRPVDEWNFEDVCKRYEKCIDYMKGNHYGIQVYKVEFVSIFSAMWFSMYLLRAGWYTRNNRDLIWIDRNGHTTNVKLAYYKS